MLRLVFCRDRFYLRCAQLGTRQRRYLSGYPQNGQAIARFGVSLSVKMWVIEPQDFAHGVPTFALLGSSSRPEWSSDNPSSRAEHSIPCCRRRSDSWCRCRERRLHAERSLGAPHTNLQRFLPVFTAQTVSLSALG